MLIGSVAGKFVIEPPKVPCFVRDIVCEFEPTVRNAHCKTKVEVASTFFLGGADVETRDIFGNGEGLRRMVWMSLLARANRQRHLK